LTFDKKDKKTKFFPLLFFVVVRSRIPVTESWMGKQNQDPFMCRTVRFCFRVVEVTVSNLRVPMFAHAGQFTLSAKELNLRILICRRQYKHVYFFKVTIHSNDFFSDLFLQF
jgi:hypothetical protein